MPPSARRMVRPLLCSALVSLMSEKVRFSMTDKINYSNATSKLLRDFEVQIKDAKPVLDSLFGPVGILTVTLALQRIVDQELVRHIHEFRKHLNVARFVTEGRAVLEGIRNKSQSPFSARRLPSFGGQRVDEEPFSSQDLPTILQQISAISETVESHRQFLSAILKVLPPPLFSLSHSFQSSKVAIAQLADSPRAPHLSQARQDEVKYCQDLFTQLSSPSALDQELHVLIGEYCGIDAAFLFANINKLLTHSDNAIHNLQSLADEIFYLIQETSTRAMVLLPSCPHHKLISSGHPQCHGRLYLYQHS